MTRSKPKVVMIEVRQYENGRYRTVGTIRLYDAKAKDVMRKLRGFMKEEK